MEATTIQQTLAAMPAPVTASVTGVGVEEEAEWELPFYLAGAIGGGLFGAGFLFCILASICSNSVRKGKGQEPAGCCGTGCCSFNAVKSWAFAEFTACGLIAGSVFFLYNNMQGLTDIIVSLLEETLPALSDSSQPQEVQNLAAQIPTSVTDTIAQYSEQVKLLPFAVMGPGALAIVFLLLGSVCPLHPRKGTYCCTKLMSAFATLFLVIAFIFYLIFVAVSVTVKYAPPAVADNINQITGLCTQVPRQVQQLLADNALAVDTLNRNGVDTTAATVLLGQVATLYVTVEQGCASLNGIFTEFENLFVPGLTCVVAICFAMYVNMTLCCAAGCCCKAPPSNGAKMDKSSHVSV